MTKQLEQRHVNDNNLAKQMRDTSKKTVTQIQQMKVTDKFESK